MRGLVRLIFARLSAFAAASVSFGAAGGLAAHFVDANPLAFFTFGALLPVGPMTLYFSSSRALRGSLAYWKQMHEDELLTERQFQQLRQAAVDWYSVRWYGKSEAPELRSLEDAE